MPRPWKRIQECGEYHVALPFARYVVLEGGSSNSVPSYLLVQGYSLKTAATPTSRMLTSRPALSIGVAPDQPPTTNRSIRNYLNPATKWERLCSRSSINWLKGSFVPKHSVEDNDCFPHGGDDGDLSGFTGLSERLIEGFDR